MLASCFIAAAAFLLESPSRVGAGCTRRALLSHVGGSVAACGAIELFVAPAIADVASQVLQYDSEGRLLDNYSEQTQFRTLRSGRSSVRVLAAWSAREDGSYDDPTLGPVTAGIAMSSTKTAAQNTAALGRPERLDLMRTFGLESELERADLVAAAIRTEGGVTFYDFDLALPAKTCIAELATACLPTRVILLSCGVCDGELYTARIDATADQWKRGGSALRLLRSSFSVES